MMRIVSFWRTTCTTKSSRERSLYPIAPSRASSSAVESTKQKNGSKKTSQASWKVTLCLRRLVAAFSESHSKVCPRSSSPVSTTCSVYTLHVRVKRPQPFRSGGWVYDPSVDGQRFVYLYQ